MNLEQLIDEAYSKHQAELKAKGEAQKLQEQQEIEKAIAQMRSRLDEVISLEIQKDLGIEFSAKIHDSAVGKFAYKDTKFYIQYGPYTGGEWGVKKGIKSFDAGHLSHVRSEGLLNYLLIQMGEIRASFIDPEPEQMTLEQAASILDDCLDLAEDVYEHRYDFIHNPEEFGSSLKAAICLMSKLLDDLAESEEDSE